VYTGVLQKDCTEEQIMSAKKTVQVITEVDGQKYVSEFGGTSVIALTHEADGEGCRIEGRSLCDSHAMMHFVEILFKELSVKDRILILLKLNLELSNKSGGKQHE
jgi:hypothetical protein